MDDKVRGVNTEDEGGEGGKYRADFDRWQAHSVLQQCTYTDSINMF